MKPIANTVKQNAEMMDMLAKFRLNAIAGGVLATTADQLVTKLTVILSKMIDEFGVKYEDSHFVGLNGATLQDWQAQMVVEEKADSTRVNYTIILNEFLRWGCSRNLFGTPDSSVPLYEVLKSGRIRKDNNVEKEVYTEQKVEKLISQMGGNKNTLLRDKAIVAMFVGSGIRSFSLCGMKIKDYRDQEHGRIYILNKGGKHELAHLADFAYPFIDRYLETRPDADDPEAPLWMSQKGRQMTSNALYKIITRKQEELGLPEGLHIFRHSFISAAEKIGGLAVARDLAIHRSVTTTNIYAHTTEEDRMRAINGLPWNQLKI